MNRFLIASVGFLALGWAGAAEAGCLGRADFDACMQAEIGALQQQNAMGQQALWQNYLRQFGPQLQQEYMREGGPSSGYSFEQFAYYMLMSANGTNPQAALDQQRRNFDAWQQAHGTVMSGNNDYNRGWEANSDAQTGAVENYDRGAVRGNTVIDTPNGPQEVPYTNVPNGTVISAGGAYYQMTPGGWQPYNGN